MKYEIKPTEDLYTLNKFFEENDLEIGDEDGVTTLCPLV